MDKKVNVDDVEIFSELNAGEALKIRINTISVPVESTFVGMEKHEYVLIKHPTPFQTVKSKLFPGNDMVVQCLHEGTAIAFQSRIIELVVKPIRLLVLAYPSEIVLRSIRNMKRINCALPVTLESRGVSKTGVVTDISNKGCGIFAKYTPSERNYILRNNEPLLMKCRFPGIANEKKIVGIVKNSRRFKLDVSYGVQFHELNRSTQEIITEYLEAVHYVR